MQLWSSNQAAFVDFADGYSYLPGIPKEFGISGELISDIDISTVLHEFTHQCQLMGSFGWLCAYLQSLRYFCKESSVLQASVEKRSLKDKNATEHLRQVSIFYEKYSHVAASFIDLISCYRPLLEGIALYAQLDYVPSRERDATSELFPFLAEAYNVAWRFPVKKIETLDDLVAYSEEYEDKLKFTNRAGEEDFLEHIYQLFDRVRESILKSGIIRFLLEDINPATSHYYTGYILIKKIQRILAEKDPRISDSEVFLIFIQRYFFCDSRLIELCQVDSRGKYQLLINKFITQSISNLIEASPERICLAVDNIVNYPEASVDYGILDFATVLREGKLALWTDQNLQKKFIDQIMEFVRSVDGDFIETLQDIDGGSIRELWKAGRQTIFLFDLLCKVMRSFKVRHTQRIFLEVVSHNETNNTVRILTCEPDAFWDYRDIPQEDFLVLKRELENGSFTFASTDENLNPIISSKEIFEQALSKYYEDGNLLIFQEYYLYLPSGKEFCRVWIYNNFFYVASFNPWEQIKSNYDLQLLKSVGSMFSHNTYIPMLQVPEWKDKPIVPEDTKIQQSLYLSLLSLVFPNTAATPEELDLFTNQRAKLIIKSKAEKAFMQKLYSERQVKVEKNQSLIQAINHRWHHYTGHNLIQVSETETGFIAQIQI